MAIAQPIVKRIDDNIEALTEFEKQIKQSETENTKKVILNFPTVYVHNRKASDDYEVYVGESNNVLQRTKQHFDEIANSKSWQNKLIRDDASLYIIGHEHFNKSLTLDIENRLINYMMSVECVKRVYNGRGNPQNEYYPVDEFETIFNEIWRKLRTYNRELFPTVSSIKDSAIFKASPLHKLTADQEQAKAQIIQMVEDALRNNKMNQLVFVDGEAGTGKTVLNSSTFYELYCNAEEREQNISCWLLVNHDEQVTVYQQIADKLGITDKYGNVVCKPTTFINNHNSDNPVDVVFVDEAHLLLTQGKQSYQGNNQLQDIVERARVTVVMFDENQILSTEQFWESQILDGFREKSKRSNSYITLNEQLRMHVDPLTQDWIDSFTKRREVKKIPKDSKGYEIKVFDTPEELDYQIQLKANDPDTSLSRLIATYDWEYSSNHRPEERMTRYWEVLIGNWRKPWNRELDKELNRAEKRRNKRLAWAEQPQTIHEVGSTFTIQGFDLNYAGVILGPSVKYEEGRIVFKPENSFDEKAVRNRTLSDNTKQKFGEVLIQHAVRVLMTRGVNGLYIYACDPELRRVLKEATL
ncbi:MAG: DUF2075 domain-containing protein [Clostridia bacterium]|nr:DUF2075 domain-containing protein [Clostridia bacterium]